MDSNVKFQGVNIIMLNAFGLSSYYLVQGG